MYTKAFSPTGPTVTISASTTAPSGVQALEVGTNAGYQFRVHNGGTVMAFLGYGTSAGAAQSAALVASGIPLPAGVVEVLSFPVGSYFSAITASSTASVYVTPGKGL